MELLVKLPPNICEGEPGTPLHITVVGIIKQLASIGWCVVDFGEATDEYVELWFIDNKNPFHAKEMAAHFIKSGGDV